MKFKWTRDGSGWVSGDWRIEKVWSPAPKGYGWYVTEPIDGGYYDALGDAKMACQRGQEIADIEAANDEEAVRA